MPCQGGMRIRVESNGTVQVVRERVGEEIKEVATLPITKGLRQSVTIGRILKGNTE